MSSSNILSKTISNPLLLLTISFTLLAGSLISFLYNDYLGFGFLISAIAVFFISIIHSILLKKWRRLITYISFHLIFFVMYIIGGFIISMLPALGPEIIKGEKQFYADRFQFHSSLEIASDLEIFCKQDTIIGIGPGGGDYKAVCIYSLDENQSKYIENKLKSDTTYQKISSLEFQNILDDNQALNCTKSITYSEYGYKSGNGSMMYSYVIFSKDKNHMLFCVDYY